LLLWNNLSSEAELVGTELIIETETDTKTMYETNASQSDDSATKGALLGIWQSDSDALFVRKFAATGYVDSYAGEVSSTGEWNFAPADTLPYSSDDIELPTTDSYIVLQDEAETEVLFFKIAEITDSSLVLIYLNRGGVLTFTRQ